MATPPSLNETISTNLSEAGLGKQSSDFKRFIIEKPFGYDLESAKRFYKTLHEQVLENQIFRIDHYSTMFGSVRGGSRIIGFNTLVKFISTIIKMIFHITRTWFLLYYIPLQNYDQ